MSHPLTRPVPLPPLSRRHFVAWITASMAAPLQAAAESRLRLIVPLGAGGATDLAARALAGALASEIGREVQVDNLPGTGGATATSALLAAPADGLTLLFAPVSIAALPLTMKASPFASLADLDILAAVGGNRLCLYVHPALGVETVPSFMERARLTPLRMGRITLGETLVTTQLMRAGGFAVEHMPYSGSPQLLADLADGRLHAALLPSSSGAALVTAGRLRMLACAGEPRIAALPTVPTMAEAGLPGLRAPTGHVIVAAAGMPRDRSTGLSEALLRAAARPEVLAEFGRLHLDGPAMGAHESLALVRETEAVWRHFVRDAGIAPQ